MKDLEVKDPIPPTKRIHKVGSQITLVVIKANVCYIGLYGAITNEKIIG